MMSNQPRLVNKQFNSPINLYSQQNIQEVLDRDMQVLTNGGVGINFYNPTVGKPANLHNSAVLRMIEEESKYQNSPIKREGNIDICSESVRRQPKWPPPENERKRRFRSAFRDVVISGTKRVAWPPIENAGDEGSQPQEREPSPISIKSVPRVNPPTASNRTPLKPLNITPQFQTSNQSPRSPILQQNLKGYGQNPSPKGWAPVHSPVSPKTLSSPSQPSYSVGFSKSPNVVQVPSETYTQVSSQSFESQEYQSREQRPITPCYIPSKVIEPPPSTITLRPQAPVSQAPPPVFTSQPATATLKGGKCLRGDMKWPPENVKKQAEEENRLRLELAKGPVFRPRKVKKDYSGFFAQHALNSTYPGYRAPPGTQYYAASDY